MSQNDQSDPQGHTLAPNTRDSRPAAKHYYHGIFGHAMLEVKKKSRLNKATNHEVTKQKTKIAKVADVSTSQMLHCSRFLLINILSFRASFLLSHSSVFFQSNCLFLLSQTQQIQ